MQKRVRKSWVMSIAILLCACHSAFAAGTATLTLTGAGNNIMGGVFVNPYTAKVNGTPMTVICDDFADNTYLNETWNANTYTYTELEQGTASVKWSSGYYYNSNGTTTAVSQLQSYYAAAALTLQLLSATDATLKGELSYAIWGVFDKGAISWLNNYSTTYATAAKNLINAAVNQTYTTGQFANFNIYNPWANSSTYAPTCSGGPCPTAPPQEMLSVAMPEPPMVALLAVDLGALFGLVVLLRRRLARVC
jgi:hypothetical protein